MFNRRDFMKAGTMAGALSLLASEGAMAARSLDEFKAYQAARRADFNGDGLLDIATPWEQGGVVRVYPILARTRRALPGPP